jgi:hypothetical protein
MSGLVASGGGCVGSMAGSDRQWRRRGIVVGRYLAAEKRVIADPWRRLLATIGERVVA